MQDAVLSLYVTEYFLYNTHYLYKIHIPNLDIYLSINQDILIPSDKNFLKKDNKYIILHLLFLIFR